MATHVVSFKNQEEFFNKIKNKDKDLIVKMTKTILYAIKHKKPKIDIFEVIFTDPKNSKDLRELILTKEKSDYISTLNEIMGDLIKFEEYELCGEIKAIIEKKKHNSKQKV